MGVALSDYKTQYKSIVVRSVILIKFDQWDLEYDWEALEIHDHFRLSGHSCS